MAENQSKMFLVAAIVMGVLATVIAFVFINSTAAQDRRPKTRILVAAHDLRANAIIDPERDLKIQEIPAEFASLARQCLDPDARATYRGQRVNRRILGSQPVFLADLAAMGSLELHEPYRALTIPADAGLVIPGDHVQVLVSQQDTGGIPIPAAPGKPSPNAMLVAGGKAFRVLAVGGNLSKTRSQATNADQAENNATARTVTLEVTPEEAQQVVGSISSTSNRNLLLICPPAQPAATNP